MRTVLAAVLACIAVHAGCSRSPTPVPPAADSKQGTIEYTVVAPSMAGPSTRKLPYFGAEHDPSETVEVLLPLQRASVAQSSNTLDELGYPALSLVFTGADAKAFEKFTGEHVGEELVLVLDGRIVSRAHIGGALPGSVPVVGRYTEDQIAELQVLLD